MTSEPRQDREVATVVCSRLLRHSLAVFAFCLKCPCSSAYNVLRMAEGKLSLFLIIGSDEGAVAEAAAKQYATLIADSDPYNHEVFDGKVSDSESAQLACHHAIESLCTMPMFGGKKVVWLRDCSFFGDNVVGRSATTEATLAKLQTFLTKGLPPEVSLLISATEFDRRRTTAKFVYAQASVQTYNKPDLTKNGWEQEIAAMVRTSIKARGMNIKPDALDSLVHRTNESARQIDADMEKMDLFLGPERREITLEDIYLMIPLTRSGNIFEISRALEQRNPSLLISLIDFQLDKGESAVSVLRASIIPPLRNLLSSKILCNTYNLHASHYNSFMASVTNLPAEASPLIPTKRDGTPNIYPLFLAAQAASKFSMPAIKAALRECARVDKLLVSSALDARLLLHELAIAIVS